MIIVGGGPAGSLAAMNIAREGYDVLLIEKFKIPREKPCGGLISMRSLSRFPYLKDEIQKITLNYFNTAYVYSPSLLSLKISYAKPINLAIRRSEFDAMLIKQAVEKGVSVNESTKVIDIKIANEGVELFTHDGKKIKSKAIVGADGANSIVARRTGLNIKWGEKKLAIALNTIREDKEERCYIGRNKGIHIFYGFNNSTGYGWIFPKQGFLNLGIGVLLDKRKIKLQNLYQHFINCAQQKKLISDSFNSDNFKAGLIPATGVISKTYTDRVVLCGDAGGFVNAFTSEGIFYAMISGEIAAKTLVEGLKNHDLSENMLRSYQVKWKAEIGNELEKTVRVHDFLFKKHERIDKLIQLATKSEKFKEQIARYALGNSGFYSLAFNYLYYLLVSNKSPKLT